MATYEEINRKIAELKFRRTVNEEMIKFLDEKRKQLELEGIQIWEQYDQLLKQRTFLDLEVLQIVDKYDESKNKED